MEEPAKSFQSAAPHLSLVARSQSRGNPLVFCLSLGFPRVWRI